jgi:MFS family permease
MTFARTAPALLVILSGVVAALHIGKMPPAIPVLRDALGVSLVQAGFLLSIVQLAGMTLGMLLGVAADSIGRRRSIIAGQLLLAGASICGMWAHGPADLLLLRALEGLGFLLTVLSAPSLIRQLVPLHQLARHLGLWGTYMPTGTAIALFLAPAMMGMLGWQGWWGLLGGLSAAMALWVFLQVPPDPPGSGATPVSGDAATGDRWWLRLRLTLCSAGPWRTALAFLLYSSQWLAVIGFLPSIYAQGGLSGQTAGTLTALVCLANITGNIGAGQLLHRGASAHRLLYVGFVSMAVTAFLTFGQATSEMPALRYAAVLMFSAIGGLIPGTLFVLAVRVAPSEQTVSTTVGWMQQCSSTGQFFGPPLVAWLATRTGDWHWTWVATGAASLLGLLLARGLGPAR